MGLRRAGERVVALAGNPNTGKSTVFNALTGLNQHTGNWPGKTVALAYGSYNFNGLPFVLVDLPGTYSLLANSPEEQIARDYLCFERPDATVVVVDATCLERNLNLVLQVIEITSQTVVCVNLIDEARRKRIAVDREALAEELGVPVVLCAARAGEGLEELKAAVAGVVLGRLQPRPRVVRYRDEVDCDAIASDLYQRAQAIAERCVRQTGPRRIDWDSRLDSILTSRVWGFPVMLALLGVVFWLTVTGANYPSQVLAKFLFWGQERLSDLFLRVGAPAWLHGLVVLGSYRTLAWVVSVMLPPMAIFFPCFTLLEDLGYLARVTFNLDSFFKKCGAHGKQALTMCMGFGCNAAGVIACRIIDSPRERLIALLTNNFVPCNGRFPTLITLASLMVMGATAARLATIQATLLVVGVVLLGIAVTLGVSWLLSQTLLRGIPSSFLLELPPYRKPQVGKILVRSIFDRTIFVLLRAVMVAAPAGAVIWTLGNVMVAGRSIIAHLAGFLAPLGRAIGLDGFILAAFLLGLPANEIVLPILLMSYLSSGTLTGLDSLEALGGLFAAHGWTWLTAVNMMLFSLLHYPCSTTLLTIRTETGSLKWTFLAAAIPLAVAVLVCVLVAQSVRLLGLPH